MVKYWLNHKHEVVYSITCKSIRILYEAAKSNLLNKNQSLFSMISANNFLARSSFILMLFKGSFS